MSGVELPQVVVSARGSSSGSHRSLYSAGSNSSNTRLTSDQEYSQTEDDNDDDEQEEPPEEETSQGGLWDEVEQFLNKPPPSFGVIAKGVDSKTITTSGSRLPTLLKSERKPELPRYGGNQAKGGGSHMRSGSSNPKAIDPKLLEEAFAYAAYVQRQNVDDFDEEGDEQQQQHRQTSSSGKGNLRQDSFGPSRVTPHELKKQRKEDIKLKKKKNNGSTSHSAYGAPLKPPVKKKTGARTSTTGEWDSTATSVDNDRQNFSSSSSCTPATTIDPQTLQALVSNFQNGTTLDELRRELAASQHSIAMSRQVIQDAAKTFFKTA